MDHINEYFIPRSKNLYCQGNNKQFREFMKKNPEEDCRSSCGVFIGNLGFTRMIEKFKLKLLGKLVK